MVGPDGLSYCSKRIEPGVAHWLYTEDPKRGGWTPITWGSLYGFCAYETPDVHKTREMCDRCAKVNGIVW